MSTSTLPAWVSGQMNSTGIAKLVFAHLQKQLSVLHAAESQLEFHLSDPKWMAAYHTAIAAAEQTVGVLHKLANNVDPTNIGEPGILLDFDFRGNPAFPISKPWEIFGLTEIQWNISLRDVLIAMETSSLAHRINSTLERKGLNTVGDLYVRWRGDDQLLMDSTPNFGKGSLALLKQALTKAQIALPEPEAMT